MFPTNIFCEGAPGLVPGVIHLVAIHPENGAINGRWFGADAAGAREWASSANRERFNVYFTANVAREGVHRKPKKEDIIEIRVAHVDIDPYEGFDRALVIEDLKSCEWPPDMIIDSGNGLQALWILSSPVPPLEIEAINRGLAQRFKADMACCNVDRLLRVPNTVNFPNAAKRARGRDERWAHVVLPKYN